MDYGRGDGLSHEQTVADLDEDPDQRQDADEDPEAFEGHIGRLLHGVLYVKGTATDVK